MKVLEKCGHVSIVTALYYIFVSKTVISPLLYPAFTQQLDLVKHYGFFVKYMQTIDNCTNGI